MTVFRSLVSYSTITRADEQSTSGLVFLPTSSSTLKGDTVSYIVVGKRYRYRVVRDLIVADLANAMNQSCLILKWFLWK